MVEYAMIPPAYRGAQLSMCDPQVKRTAAFRHVRQADSVSGLVTLAGPPGRGKSWLAAAWLRALMDTHVLGTWLQWPIFVSNVTHVASDTRAVWRETIKAPALVMDDVGAEHKSEWTAALTREVISFRVDLGAPTVLTTNLPRATLAARYGDAVASRLDGGQRFVVDGDDLRVKADPE